MNHAHPIFPHSPNLNDPPALLAFQFHSKSVPEHFPPHVIPTLWWRSLPAAGEHRCAPVAPHAKANANANANASPPPCTRAPLVILSTPIALPIDVLAADSSRRAPSILRSSPVPKLPRRVPPDTPHVKSHTLAPQPASLFPTLHPAHRIEDVMP